MLLKKLQICDVILCLFVTNIHCTNVFGVFALKFSVFFKQRNQPWVDTLSDNDTILQGQNLLMYHKSSKRLIADLLSHIRWVLDF